MTQGHTHGADGSRAKRKRRRAPSVAETIQHQVHSAYEARPRPPAPDFGMDEDPKAASKWHREEAAAMHVIAERLVPPGWTYEIQLGLIPPGPHLVLEAPRHARKR